LQRELLNWKKRPRNAKDVVLEVDKKPGKKLKDMKQLMPKQLMMSLVLNDVSTSEAYGQYVVSYMILILPLQLLKGGFYSWLVWMKRLRKRTFMTNLLNLEKSRTFTLT
jgi:hypothetical protein